LSINFLSFYRFCTEENLPPRLKEAVHTISERKTGNSRKLKEGKTVLLTAYPEVSQEVHNPVNAGSRVQQ